MGSSPTLGTKAKIVNMRILLVEDDLLLGDAVKKGLIQAGFTVDWLATGSECQHALRYESFDLVILDLGLPGLSGLEILKYLRADGQTIPVLILTARDSVEDRIEGLDSGADDYLTKPFDLDELCARARALIRRSLGRTANLIQYKNLILDSAARQITIDGQVINLPRREFSLLQHLLENVGQIITREQLAQNMYGWAEDVDSNTLEVHVHNLRKKLNIDYIHTVRGVGYMIKKDV